LVISVGPYDAGPNFIWVFDAAAQRLVIPAASVQRWADEIVIWPVVEASWHRNAIHHGSRNTSGSATRRAAGKDRCRLGDIPTPIPTRAWPARQAGFNPIQLRVNKLSPAQNLVRFRLSAGATKAGTRNCRLWCTLAGGVTFARISQSSDGICTARKRPSRLRTT
jgi:hypothetical protein